MVNHFGQKIVPESLKNMGLELNKFKFRTRSQIFKMKNGKIIDFDSESVWTHLSHAHAPISKQTRLPPYRSEVCSSNRNSHPLNMCMPHCGKIDNEWTSTEHTHLELVNFWSMFPSIWRNAAVCQETIGCLIVDNIFPYGYIAYVCQTADSYAFYTRK